jgi:WD40 repeat protein
MTLTTHIADRCAVSADGSLVVSTGQEVVKFWDVASGTERMPPGDHPWCGMGCAISPDGSFAVSASMDLKGYRDGGDTSSLKIWDLSTGWARTTLKGEMGQKVTKLSQTLFTDCDISSDGSLIVSSSMLGNVRVWDAATGDEVRTWAEGTGDLLTTCALSNDDSVVVTGTRQLKLWETQTGRELATFEGHPDEKDRKGGIWGVALSSDKTFVVSAGTDGVLKIWDAAAALA